MLNKTMVRKRNKKKISGVRKVYKVVKEWFEDRYESLNDGVWWINYRLVPKHKYHIVRLGTKPGYSDVRERLIYANFALLKEFIELGKPFESIDWEATPEHSHAAKEMKSLYDWWVNVRPKRDELDPINKVKMPENEFIPCKWYDNGEPMLYEWRSIGTPAEEELWSRACKASMEYEQTCTKEDNDNLKRLIDIRIFLWD